MAKIRIVFGAFAHPLHVQLRVQPRLVKLHQRRADAITLLRVSDLLTESETRRARTKLTKHISHTLDRVSGAREGTP